MAARWRGARAIERFRDRSRHRWWIGFVLVPVLLLGVVGLVVGVPPTRLVPRTAPGDEGAPSPTAAVTTYLDALNDGDEEALAPVLDDARGDALIRQWREYRAETQHGTAAFRLASRMPITRPVDERHVTVEVAVWPAADGSGQPRHGAAHVWRFGTREDHGWRIVSVTPFPWCGGYVAAAACA
jgi:hypothetical protein